MLLGFLLFLLTWLVVGFLSASVIIWCDSAVSSDEAPFFLGVGSLLAPVFLLVALGHGVVMLWRRLGLSDAVGRYARALQRHHYR